MGARPSAPPRHQPAQVMRYRPYTFRKSGFTTTAKSSASTLRSSAPDMACIPPPSGTTRLKGKHFRTSSSWSWSGCTAYPKPTKNGANCAISPDRILEAIQGDLNDGLCRFGILLRTLRKELGVSQRELCRALGKDSKYICNLEYGYTRVTRRSSCGSPTI